MTKIESKRKRKHVECKKDREQGNKKEKRDEEIKRNTLAKKRKITKLERKIQIEIKRERDVDGKRLRKTWRMKDQVEVEDMQNEIKNFSVKRETSNEINT